MEDATESEAMHESSALLENSEFWNQFAGSSTANGFVILLIALAAGLRKLCNRNSKCKSHLHCCCLDVDIKDQTLRERPDNLDEGQGGTV